MFSAFLDAFYTELQSIKNSWYKLSLMSALPIFSFILIMAIFNSGVVRELPLAVVDHDKSALSRALISQIEASSTMKIAYMPTSTKEAMRLVKSTKAYGLIVIPVHFSRDTLLQKHPQVTAMLNTQYILIGKILSAALTSSMMQSAAQVSYVKNLISLENPELAKNAITPIKIQITPFFNSYKNYFYFLVSALLPAIWQIFIVVATLVSVGTLFKEGRERVFFKNNNYVAAKLFGLLFPYTLAFMLLGLVYLFYLYSYWPFNGSMIVLILGMFLTVIAYQVIALFLFATSFDYARSLSLGAVYTAPAFAFLGITFPVFNMNGFALFWRDLLPVAHYMQLQLSQANYAANVWLESDKLLVLLLFWLLCIPVLFLFKKRLKKVFV